MKKETKSRIFLRTSGIILLVVLLNACVSQKNVRLVQEKVNKEMTTNFENPKSTSYRIQTGDHLYIRVYSIDPKTSKFFQSDLPYLMNSTYQYLHTHVVDEFGYVSFSFIDKLFVKGMSVDEVQKALQAELDKYFKETTAYVKLVNFQVGVLGEVTSPGNFTIEQDQINIFQAIGLANGITDFGNLEEVKLIRQTQSGSEVHMIDLTDNQLLASPYYYLMPNDVIYIEPRSAKPWAYSQFPYQTLVSFLSVGILAAALFLD